MKKVIIIEDDIRIARLIKGRINKSDEYICTKIFTSPLLFLSSEETADIILLDILMPEINGIKAISLIKKKAPDVSIIMNTILEDSDTIYEAIREGAVGYIDKQSFDQNFENVFNAVINEGAYMTPKIARKVMQHFQKPKNEYKKLTPRENDIINGILEGLSYKLIANKHQISLDTVRMNVRHVYKKLNINSKGELFKIMSDTK